MRLGRWYTNFGCNMNHECQYILQWSIFLNMKLAISLLKAYYGICYHIVLQGWKAFFQRILFIPSHPHPGTSMRAWEEWGRNINSCVISCLLSLVSVSPMLTSYTVQRFHPRKVLFCKVTVDDVTHLDHLNDITEQPLLDQVKSHAGNSWFGFDLTNRKQPLFHGFSHYHINWQGAL